MEIREYGHSKNCPKGCGNHSDNYTKLMTHIPAGCEIIKGNQDLFSKKKKKKFGKESLFLKGDGNYLKTDKKNWKFKAKCKECKKQVNDISGDGYCAKCSKKIYKAHMRFINEGLIKIGNEIVKAKYLEPHKWYKIDFYIKQDEKGRFLIDEFRIVLMPKKSDLKGL